MQNLEILLSKIVMISRPLRPETMLGSWALLELTEVIEKTSLVLFPERENQTKASFFRTLLWQLESNRPLNDSTQWLQPSELLSGNFLKFY